MVVAHVVFARPQHLHRHADLLGDRRRLAHVVVGQPPAEAAARALDVNGDVLRRDVERGRHELAPVLRRLRRRPDLHLAVAVVRRAVLRLERRVRDERIRVRGLDDLRRALRAPDRRCRRRAAGTPASAWTAPAPAAQSLRCSAARSALRSTSPAAGGARVCACHQLSATIATPGISPRVSVVPSTTNACRTPGSALISSRLALTTVPP